MVMVKENLAGPKLSGFCRARVRGSASVAAGENTVAALKIR
jgi:hypothetical protein